MALLIDSLISDIRKNTDNEEFDSTVGYSDEEIIRFINDAKNYIHSRIVAQHSSAFVEEYTVSTNSDVESYTLPFNAFLKNKISNIEWSVDGNTDNFFPLKRISHKLRRPGLNGDPSEYSFKNGKIYLSPIPQNSSGSLRISYVQSPKQVNKRRGQIIATAQCSDSLTAPTYIYIDYLDAINDPVELARETQFCVVDKFGNIKMSNLILDSIGAAGSTGDATSYDAILNISSDTSFNSGDVIAQGYYIIPTKWASSHIDLEESIQKYVRQFAENEVLQRDSSLDLSVESALLKQLELDIIASFAEISDDIDYIPEINSSWDPSWL